LRAGLVVIFPGPTTFYPGWVEFWRRKEGFGGLKCLFARVYDGWSTNHRRARSAELALERVILLQAVASRVRWQVLQILATEGPQAVNDLAARVDRAQHSMSKHLQVLRMAGAVVMVAGTDGDGRKPFHAIPSRWARS